MRPGKHAVAAEELRSVIGSVVALFLEKDGVKLSVDLLPSINEIVETAMQDPR